MKSVQILHVFGPKFFSGGPPEFLDLDYLIGVDSDHVVKFRGDRPRELGDPVSDLNKKAQLSLTNPRDAKACQNCSNSTCLQRCR